MNKVKAGFVVLNYGSPTMAIGVCSSIAEKMEEAHIVFVDNFSSEENRGHAEKGVRDLSETRHCGFFFLPLPENGGYGPGNNAGLAYLFEKTDAEVAFVVNSDVRVCSLDFSGLESGVRDDTVYAAQLFEHGRSRIGVSVLRPWCFLRKDLACVSELGVSGGNVPYVSGCFWGMSRGMFKATGGFAEDYFLYFEELDFFYRYKKEFGAFPGIVLLEGVEAEHFHGATTGISRKPGDRSLVAEYCSARSRMIFSARWLKPFWPFALLYNMTLAGRSFLRGHLRSCAAIIRASFDGMLGRNMYRQRRGA